MNTLRGIISLTMLSFLVTATGTWDNQALALAKPTVVRKKIQIPPAPRDKKPSVVVPTLSPKADIAKAKTVQKPRPSPVAKTGGADPRAKSDLASAPSEKSSPLVKAQKSPAPKVPPNERSEPRRVEPVSTADAAAVAGRVDVIHTQVDGPVDDGDRLFFGSLLFQGSLATQTEDADLVSRAAERTLGHGRRVTTGRLVVQQQCGRAGGPGLDKVPAS